MAKKSSAGRKAGFSLKGHAGERVWDIEEAASRGDWAVTPGAKLVKRWRGAIFWRTQMPGADADCSVARAMEAIEVALEQRNAAIFKQIAEYFEGERRGGESPNPQLAKAAYFVAACRGDGFDVRAIWKGRDAELRKSSGSGTLVMALRRRPFTPSINEICSFLSEIFEDPPDDKTVARWALALGIAPHRSGSKAKGQL